MYRGQKVMEKVMSKARETPSYEASGLWKVLQDHPLENRHDGDWIVNFLGTFLFPHRHRSRRTGRKDPPFDLHRGSALSLTTP